MRLVKPDWAQGTSTRGTTTSRFKILRNPGNIYSCHEYILVSKILRDPAEIPTKSTRTHRILCTVFLRFYDATSSSITRVFPTSSLAFFYTHRTLYFHVPRAFLYQSHALFLRSYSHYSSTPHALFSTRSCAFFYIRCARFSPKLLRHRSKTGTHRT